MNECEVDGCEKTALVSGCSYCSGSFCPDHQLPEKHSCPQVKIANTHGPDFRASDKTVQIGSKSDQDTGPEKKECASSGCSTIVAPSKEYCRSCRHQPSVPSEYQSPDVELKDGDGSEETDDSSRPFVASLKIRLETIGIRTRGWLMVVFQLAAIGIFGLGLWALYTLFTSPVIQTFGGEVAFLDLLALGEPIEFLGWSVPEVDISLVSLTPMETLFALSLLFTFGGLALSFKLIFGTTTPGIR